MPAIRAATRTHFLALEVGAGFAVFRDGRKTKYGKDCVQQQCQVQACQTKKLTGRTFSTKLRPSTVWVERIS